MLLKLLSHAADNPFVQKSAIITGLTLALSAATLAGIGDWASNGFGDPAGESASSIASPLANEDYSATSYIAFASLSPALSPEPASYSTTTSAGYTIHHTVPEVRLQFTVADQQGRLIQDLSSADIRVLDNQTLVQHFSDFSRDQNLPLRLGIVIDTSDSVRRVLPEEKTAALTFLNRVMRPDVDRTFIMAFGADVQMWQTSTDNRARLLDAVGRLHQPGWGTRFYDALYTACEAHLSPRDDTAPVHRAIIVLSDGEDTQSFRELRDVVAIAQRGEIQIYALTLRKNGSISHSDTLLQRLADETGGRFFVVASSGDLAGSFAEIEQELRTQYYVSFVPQQNVPGFHALRVEVRTPHNVHVHARSGYYALAP